MQKGCKAKKPYGQTIIAQRTKFWVFMRETRLPLVTRSLLFNARVTVYILVSTLYLV